MSSIPEDDLQDVFEMTIKIESCINQILNDNQLDLAISALITSCINTLLRQCDTVQDAIFYRNVLVNLLDGSIEKMQL